jgi:hypothetical protein
MDNCDNCGTITTIEGHTDTANLVMSCESFMPIGHPENNSVCAQMEFGVYRARRISAELISFWADDKAPPDGPRLHIYSVKMEELRDKR